MEFYKEKKFYSDESEALKIDYCALIVISSFLNNTISKMNDLSDTKKLNPFETCKTLEFLALSQVFLALIQEKV